MVETLINKSQIVLHFLLQEVIYSGFIFLIIAGLAFLLRHKSAVWQMALWSLVLVRLVLPVNWHFRFSVWNLFNQLLSGPAKENLSGNVYFGFPEEMMTETSTMAVNQETLFSWQNFLPILLICIWITGVLVLLTIFIKRYLKYKKLVNHSSVVEDKHIRDILFTWKKHFNIKRTVIIITEDFDIIPFTMGTLRPVIFLPQNIVRQNQKHILEPVIAHELAHIKRLDDLFIRLQSFIQIIYFFNPVVWITTSRINLARECVCDSMVLFKGAMTLTNYAQGILNVLKNSTFENNHLIPMPAFGNQKQKLKTRILKMKGTNQMQKNHLLLVGMAVMLLGFTILPMAKESSDLILKTDAEQNINSTDVTEKVKPEKTEKFICPVKFEQITLKFGISKDPFNPKMYYKHMGIDLRAKKGEPVAAVADGTVLKAETKYKINKGYGKFITIQHNDGVISRYAHLDAVNVEIGQKVKSGQEIGKVGTTGRSTGPHLHFELKIDDENVDPEDYIDFKNN